MEVLELKESDVKFRQDVLNYIAYLEIQKRNSGKKGTAGMYRATSKWLSKYLESKKLDIRKINARMVKDFIAHLQTTTLKRNSICNYVSTLRAAYNSAVSDKLIEPEENPFRKLGLRPSPTTKRAINVDMIKKMLDLDLKKKKRLDFARDLFLFCFMACGMTFVDLAHLTRSNINGNLLVYRRVKTNMEIRITITPGMKYLLEKYADPNSELLFPILKSRDVSYETYKVALRTYNRRLQKIGSMINCPINLTSYVARHSWAMCAKEMGVSVALIGQALGHRTEHATVYYLSDLDQWIMDRTNLEIIHFAEKWVLSRKSKK